MFIVLKKCPKKFTIEKEEERTPDLCRCCRLGHRVRLVFLRRCCGGDDVSEKNKFPWLLLHLVGGVFVVDIEERWAWSGCLFSYWWVGVGVVRGSCGSCAYFLRA